MKAVVAAFNQEKALVGAFSVITNLRMALFQALASTASVAVWVRMNWSSLSVRARPRKASSLATVSSGVRLRSSNLTRWTLPGNLALSSCRYLV